MTHETELERLRAERLAAEGQREVCADALEKVRLWGLGNDCGGWPEVQALVELALRNAGRLP